jgi:hypothetical protein
MLCLTACFQIAAYIVCAGANGVAFFRWRRWTEEALKNSWKLYGWFTACSFAACAVGCVAYIARVGNLYGLYMSGIASQIKSPTIEQSVERNRIHRWMNLFCVAHYLMFPFELLFVIASLHFVLHRMLLFANQGAHRHIWKRAGLAVFAMALAGVLVGIFSNVAAAVHFSRAADFNSEAMAAWAANNSVAGRSLEQTAKDTTSLAVNTASIQRCEARP